MDIKYQSNLQENCGAQVGIPGLSPNRDAFLSLVIPFL